MKPGVQDPLSFLGESFAFQDTREEILKNIKLIIRIRFIISPSIFLIMFVSGLFGLTQQSAFSENQIIVNGINLLVILMMNGVYTVLVRKIRNLKPLVLFQLIIDVVHFTLTVYKTGGITSPFSFLFFFVIFSTSILVSGKASYIIAGLSALFYTLIVVFEVQGIIPHQDFFSPFTVLMGNTSFLVLSWSFSTFSLFGFAALTSYLSGLLHKRQRKLEEANKLMTRKNRTMVLLYRTSKALNSYKTVREVVDYILTGLVSHMRLDRALLYLTIKNEYLHLYMVKKGGEAGAAVEIDSTEINSMDKEEMTDGLQVDLPYEKKAGLTARAAIEQKPYNIEKPEESEFINRELAKKIGLNPFAVAPLILREQTIGVIGIDRNSKNGSITDEEFQILQMFANQAAISIAGLQRIDTGFRKRYGL
jgi:hypothetical protein